MRVDTYVSVHVFSNLNCETFLDVSSDEFQGLFAITEHPHVINMNNCNAHSTIILVDEHTAVAYQLFEVTVEYEEFRKILIEISACIFCAWHAP